MPLPEINFGLMDYLFFSNNSIFTLVLGYGIPLHLNISSLAVKTSPIYLSNTAS